MKVAMIGPYPLPGRPVTGGVERVVATLLPALARRVDLSLIVPNADRDLRVEEHGVSIDFVKRSRGPGFFRYALMDARRVAMVVDRAGADVAHVHGYLGWGCWLECPQLATIHGIAHRNVMENRKGPLWQRKIAALVIRTIERGARQRAGHVAVINPYVRDIYSDLAGLCTYDIPNPVDTMFTAPLRQTVRRNRIVTVGKIGRQKNTLAAIEALCAMRVRDWQATFVGPADSPDYLRACRDLAEHHGVSDRIDFVGPVDAMQVRSLLDRASLFLMSSRQETAPVAIAEAQARGVPVVAPRAFGIPYMIEEGETGLFLPEGTAARAALIERALAHHWDHAAISAGAIARYSVDAIADMTVAAYASVLEDAAC